MHLILTLTRSPLCILEINFDGSLYDTKAGDGYVIGDAYGAC